MEIIDYDKKYDEDIKNLLVELQKYLVEIDNWHFQVLKECYKEAAFKMDMQRVKEEEGKIYLARENDEIVGMVIGIIPKKDNEDKISNTCARNGSVLELIVKHNVRGNGIGKALLLKIESYFKRKNCENISIEVYGPNTKGLNFYNKNGYTPIDYIVMKKIEKD